MAVLLVIVIVIVIVILTVIVIVIVVRAYGHSGLSSGVLYPLGANPRGLNSKRGYPEGGTLLGS